MHIPYTCINAHTWVSVRGEEKDLGFSRNRWKPAKLGPQGETSIRSGSCLLCAVFRGCKHRSMKEKNTVILREPLSAYTIFSFSALTRTARKILKGILCTDLLFLFLCFSSPAFKNAFSLENKQMIGFTNLELQFSFSSTQQNEKQRQNILITCV